MNIIKKIKIRLMRIFTIFSWTRKLALSILKIGNRNPNKTYVNDDLSYESGKIINQLVENGHSDLISIGESKLEKIIDYANEIDYLDIDSKKPYKIDYSSPTKPGKGLWYSNDKVISCEQIEQIVYDKNNVEIARKYLGVEPKIKDVRMWWSFPKTENKSTSLYGFHYDIDAYKFLKLFIYITDVDSETGPHVIISNTHKRKTIFEKYNRRLTDKMVEERFNKERIKVMTGKSGEGFFEDTFCYHKGTSPLKPRLILQIEYST
ncbi:hypothetical protein [uncultured Aquimarina sp.]|uniref:hypothetical protein n=1 Tax=uncultured Aquimarina sp. TaxID=575652 RepID=UPI0026360FE2|nr:hypothetical protein [uncultured Aquimarina sp.]